MKAHYKLTSTVMLSLKTAKKEFGVADLGGSLMRQKEADAVLSNHDSSHIANIGRLVEEMENAIRESLLTIYFDKTKSILNSLRPSVDAEEEAKRNAFANELKSKMFNRNSTS